MVKKKWMINAETKKGKMQHYILIVLKKHGPLNTSAMEKLVLSRLGYVSDWRAVYRTASELTYKNVIKARKPTKREQKIHPNWTTVWQITPLGKRMLR